jgi:hypothetical protein
VNDPTPRMRAELARLQRQIDSLERDWQRLPRMLVLWVLVIPAGMLWGPLLGALVGLGVLILVGLGGYLITVRRSEYRGEMETVRRDLRILEGQR